MLKGLSNDSRQENVNSNIYPLHDLSSSTILCPCSKQNDETQRCWFSGPPKFREAQTSHLYIQVCSFSEYQSKFQGCKSIHSLSLKASHGIPKLPCCDSFSEGLLLCLVSLQYFLCQNNPEVILPGWNSCPVALKPTHTYCWNWAEYSFTLAASGTMLFQVWYIPFHLTGFRQGSPTDTQMHTPGQFTYRTEAALSCRNSQSKNQRGIFILLTWDCEIVLRMALHDDAIYKL